jgi:ATP-dependent RNA helicase RhlE
LFSLLSNTGTGSVLVFTRTKHRAKRLGEKLVKTGYRAASLQGNLSQNRRQAALDGFRDGRHQILVATDIAARGIDVSKVSHVINYDMPNTTDAYIHRIGRTGRAARTGDAFTMLTAADRAMERALEKALGRPIERRNIEGFAIDPDSSPAGAQSHRAKSPGGNAKPGRAKNNRGRRFSGRPSHQAATASR